METEIDEGMMFWMAQQHYINTIKKIKWLSEEQQTFGFTDIQCSYLNKILPLPVPYINKEI